MSTVEKENRISEATRERETFDRANGPSDNGFNLEDRKEPRFLTFEKPGDKAEGIVAGFLRGTVRGKPAVYIFLVAGGDTSQYVKILATRQLLEKIRTSDSGRFVRIVYQGENQTVQTQGNKMKNFTVQVDSKAPPRTDLLMDTSLLEMLQDEG